MIGLCDVCKKIGLDAQWEQLPYVARMARCDNCNLYSKTNTLVVFRAEQGDLKRWLDEHPEQHILAIGTKEDGRTGDPLYCVYFWWKAVYNDARKSEWKMADEYMHGANANEVRYAFLNSVPANRRVAIIDIAPAVGWFVENEEKGILVAS